MRRPRVARGKDIDLAGARIAVLECDGGGPLALCLHGFPDTAHTWRRMLPTLADAGFRAVAPFLRGYAPSSLAHDDDYRLSTLADDANTLHELMGGTSEAVVIGHDWGAETAYLTAAAHPRNWRSVVALSVPPATLDERLLRNPAQRGRFSYLSVLQAPTGLDALLHDDKRLIDELWQRWSPGYRADDDTAWVRASLAAPDHARAAIEYYRQNPVSFTEPPASGSTFGPPCPQPTLYLHGEDDGCIDVDLVRDVTDWLAAGSRAHVVPGAGHFVHLEKPDAVGQVIIEYLR